MAYSTPNAGPFPPVKTGPKQIALVSSFGLQHTQLGPQFPAMQILNSLRAQELDYRSKFYKCTQHDGKIFDWNGSMKRPERFPTQPLIGNSMPDMYVPMNQRRPESPYRLARTIVGAFTTLIFGHGRWPSILSDDPDTQDFAEALVKATKLKSKMVRARNMAGSCGTVGISWGFADGKPRVRIHEAKNLYVEEWEDEDELIPSHVIELYQYPKDVWVESKKRHERRFFWHRRDWTENADISFVPCEVTEDNPHWTIDEDKSIQHNDEICHFVWIRNLPDDENTSIDGQPDYAELYEQLNSIDILNSVNVSGTVKNLDPTLKLKMHREEVGAALIKKGSDNALAVGPTGDANYMELSGQAVAAGHASIQTQREQALEACQCVVPDPNEVAAAATSSVALKIAYAPMLSKGDIHRDQFGDDGIIRILEGMIQAARNYRVGEVVKESTLDDEGLEVIDEVTGEPVLTDVEYAMDLPPRREKVELLDADGNPTGEFTVKETARTPGNGTLVCEWPDYFKETSDDRQKNATALTTATGGKPVMSQQTAVEQLATSMQHDPQEEWTRMRNEQQLQRDAEADMYPGVGGIVDDIEELPDGAEPIEGENAEESDAAPDPTS